ncbi:MAG: PIN domain-containing protein [Candidatus Levybacteria bacterium]|nr:PIN domain-containing protein [Candidatus Levybacteria bacterium]
MKLPAFVDTNFLCALYNRTDSLHERAKQQVPLLKKFYPVISNFILLESYTILSQRAGKLNAIEFKKKIYNNNDYQIIWIDKEFENNIWKIFKKIKDKNFSYVDVSILAIIKQEKIKHLLSFDESFKLLQKEFCFKLIGV